MYNPSQWVNMEAQPRLVPLTEHERILSLNGHNDLDHIVT